MSTTIKTDNKISTAKVAGKSKKQTAPTVPATVIPEGTPDKIERNLIDFSPLNYRKYYSEQALQEFASELLVHGIIHPLTVRVVTPGRYELVSGERRLRSATIAGIASVPVIIKELTDEQVNEIQLAENMQRENPHPMNDAQGIGQMLATGKKPKEISLRLGKSEQFVHNRIKLLSLIEPIRDMFVAGVFTMQDSLEIAAISDDSQQDFYENNCAGWQTAANFKVNNFRWVLNKYKCDLSAAPFDTADETLLPGVAACSGCPFNSATLTELFPEMAKVQTCTNRQCFEQKCLAGLKSDLQAAFEQQPEALIFNFDPSDDVMALLDGTEGAAQLPRFFKNQVTLWERPQEPKREDFLDFMTADDEEFEDMDDERATITDEQDHSTVYDEESYQEALMEYRTDMDEFDTMLLNGNLRKGLYVNRQEMSLVYFTERTVNSNSTYSDDAGKVTAKAVKEAEKEGSITVALYDGEIERLRAREKRAKEIDAEKFQLDLHDLFIAHNKEEINCPPTMADMTAVKLMLFQSLGHSKRMVMTDYFGITASTYKEEYNAELYEALLNMPDHIYTYLIRLALQGRADAKLPNTPEGFFLMPVSADAGIDVGSLKNRYAEKVRERESKMETKIFEVEKKKELLKAKNELVLQEAERQI